jgi:ankyrin repeat protein
MIDLTRLHFYLVCEDLESFTKNVNHVVVNSKFEDGSTLLHHICQRGNDVFLTVIIGMVDVNCQNKDGDTALHIATRYDNLRCFEILLENGADCNIQNLDGMTPLCEAIDLNGGFSYIQTLIAYGADVNISDQDGWTPLHYAYNRGNVKIIRYLLENKSNLCLADSEDRTPEYYYLPYIDEEDTIY